MKIGQRLAQLRKNTGYTQPQVADILNVSNGSIGHWETDTREASYDMLDKLCSLYNTTVSNLFSDSFICNKIQNNSFLNRVIIELNSEKMIDLSKEKFDDFAPQTKEILKAALVTHIEHMLKDN